MPSSITEATNMTVYRAGSNAPAGTLSRIRGALPNPTYTAVSPASPVTWSDNGAGGTFQVFSTNNEIAIYTPKNKTQLVVISAQDSGSTVTRNLTVFGTIPIQPQAGAEFELDVETKVKYARDRTRYSREEGAPEASWVWAWDNRTKADKAELMAFWYDHRKTNLFYMVDTEGDILNKVFFNSSFKAAFNGANKWAMSAAFRGVYEAITASTAAPLHLRINCGGFAIGLWQADQYFTNGLTFYDNTGVVDSSGVTDPAPDEVYRYSRYDDDYVQYLITGLRPAYPYNIRLHFAGSSARTIVPTIQLVTKAAVVIPGTQAAVVGSYTGILSDSAGQMLVRVDHTAGVNTVLMGLEVIEQ